MSNTKMYSKWMILFAILGAVFLGASFLMNQNKNDNDIYHGGEYKNIEISAYQNDIVAQSSERAVANGGNVIVEISSYNEDAVTIYHITKDVETDKELFKNRLFQGKNTLTLQKDTISNFDVEVKNTVEPYEIQFIIKAEDGNDILDEFIVFVKSI